MKINSELIQRSHHFINPLNNRQLDLRAKKLQPLKIQEPNGYQDSFMLEFFNHIDLGDNDIKKLGKSHLIEEA
ncbi:unnamed protein product [Paramecium octaurelia]|uniref:Uncharacterized protein n=1 Tax=Paramecium octaurelia TaxID=43137 RepID=A0A8S1TUH8_PAROT|nr:unnamed protein product [Paramecium octaurelia]